MADDRHRRPPKPRKSHSSSSSYGSADTHPAGNNRKHDTGKWNDDDHDGRRPPLHEEGYLPTIPPQNCYRNSYQYPRGDDDGRGDDEDDGRDDLDYDHEFLPLTRSAFFRNCTTAVTVFVLSLLLLGCWSQLDPMAHDFDGNGVFYGPNVHGVNMNANMNTNMKRNVEEHIKEDGNEGSFGTATTSTSSEDNMAAGATAASSSFFRNNNQNELQLQLQSQNPNTSIEIEQSPATSDFYQNYTKFYTTYPRRPFITHHRPPSSPITLPILGFPSLALAIYPNATAQQPLADRAVRHAVETLSLSYFDVAPEYGDGIAQSRLGPALRPYRSGVFLAAKTMYRTAVEAEIDLNHTLAALETEYLDLYQFHSLSTMDEVDLILSPGGAMDTFRKAKSEGKIRAIGYSAHHQEVAVRMIRTGLVDTCMFPINFAAYHYGKVGRKVLEAASDHGVGVIALKSGAKGRLTDATGTPVAVPPKGGFRHIPEWKREEMIRFPVMTSKDHPTEWYEPEEDEEYLIKLVLWSLNQRGVTAVLPPGDLGIFETVARGVLRMCGCYEVVNGVDVGGDGKCRVPELSEEDIEDMMERYKDVKPIFYDWDESGSKVST